MPTTHTATDIKALLKRWHSLFPLTSSLRRALLKHFSTQETYSLSHLISLLDGSPSVYSGLVEIITPYYHSLHRNQVLSLSAGISKVYSTPTPALTTPPPPIPTLPSAIQWIKENGLSRVKGINQTTSNLVRTSLADVLQAGGGEREARKVIHALFKSFSKERVKMIAQHEIADAYNAGAKIGADALVSKGLEMEQYWLTLNDSLVSDGCLENQAAGWVEVGHIYPDDITRPPRHPRCRCGMMYRVKRFQGR